LALALPYFKTTTSHAVIMKRESEKKTPGFIVEGGLFWLFKAKIRATDITHSSRYDTFPCYPIWDTGWYAS
jgi:hypothetical protein